MMDKLSLQPSRCNLPSLPALKVNLFTRISLSLFITFYSRKKGPLYFWVTKDSISYFKLCYILWDKLFESASPTLTFCVFTHLLRLQHQGLWRWGCSVKQGCRFAGIRLSHTICNIWFANRLILTYKNSQCIFTFKFTQSTLQFLVRNRWIKKALLKALKQILLQYTSWETLLWDFQFN